MSITFIILNWNTANLTIKCLSSIYKHTKLKNFQVIVVDNGSTDNSVSELKNLKYKNFHLVKNKTNLGFSKGNNSAKKFFTTDYLIFLNSDIELLDNSLSDALNYLKNNPKIGLIAPKLILPDISIQKSIFPPQTVVNAIKEFWCGNKNHFTPFIPSTDTPFKAYAVAGAALLIKTSLFKKIGMWNELYYIYFEDLDLCRQIKKHGKDIIYYPKWSLLHHHGQSGKSLATSQNQWKRLVKSSQIYHGYFKHYLLFFIIWLGQKLKN